MYIAKLLAEGYGNDNTVMRMLDTFDIYIVPSLNVDGYAYTWTDDRLWRKTRSTFGLQVCVGTEPNRMITITNGQVRAPARASARKPTTDPTPTPSPRSPRPPPSSSSKPRVRSSSVSSTSTPIPSWSWPPGPTRSLPLCQLRALTRTQPQPKPWAP